MIKKTILSKKKNSNKWTKIKKILMRLFQIFIIPILVIVIATIIRDSLNRNDLEPLNLIASIDNPNPIQMSEVTLYINVRDQNDKPVEGANIKATAYYKNVTTTHEEISDERGNAEIRFRIGYATIGYKVRVKVFAEKNGETVSKELSFTPELFKK